MANYGKWLSISFGTTSSQRSQTIKKLYWMMGSFRMMEVIVNCLILWDLFGWDYDNMMRSFSQNDFHLQPVLPLSSPIFESSQWQRCLRRCSARSISANRLGHLAANAGRGHQASPDPESPRRWSAFSGSHPVDVMFFSPNGDTLWLCQNSYWKWPFIVELPIKNCYFP